MDRIGEPLHDLLDKLHLSESMEGWRAVELWPAVVGERVASQSRAVAFRDGDLVVEVSSAAWMNELAYLKERLVEDLNRKLGATAVRSIRLQPATAHPGSTRRGD